jgi:hypothetical protein
VVEMAYGEREREKKKIILDKCLTVNQIFLVQKEIPTTIKCKFKKKKMLDSTCNRH